MPDTLPRVLRAHGIDAPITLTHPPGPYDEPKPHVVVYTLGSITITHRLGSPLYDAVCGRCWYVGEIDGLVRWIQVRVWETT